MKKTTPDLPNSEASNRQRMARIVLIGLAILAIALSVLLFVNYSRMLMYVDRTLDSPKSPPLWDTQEHVPVEACVDSALSWAANCVGIKSLCDEYVTRYMNECLGSESRRAYCSEITIDITGTTKFGSDECSSRGVRRHVDAEACGKAYRAIDAWCRYERDLAEAGKTHQEQVQHEH